MARPKIDPADRRTGTIRVSLSPHEVAAIQAKAARANLTPTAFVRAAALGKSIAVSETVSGGFQDRQELRRIGVNLNQIAKALNSRQEVSPADLAACCEKLDRIFDQWLADDRAHDQRP